MKTLKLMMEILSKKEKLGFFLLFLGMVVSSLLEILGLAILVPMVTVVAYPETAIANSSFLRAFADLFSIAYGDTKKFLLFFIIFIAIIYVIKAAYYIFFNLWKNKFVQTFSRRLSLALFSNFLYQPYEFHTYHNTSMLISRSTNDVSRFVSGLNVVISTLADITFCVITFIYLMVQEWAVTLIVFVGLGAVSLFLNWLFRKKARAYGQRASELDAINLKAIHEGLSGIKEIKISNREKHFVDTYDVTRKESERLLIRQEVIFVIPRTFVEMVGMVGMLVALVLYSFLGNPPEKVVSVFSLLALAVIKLLPYISRISAQLNSFRIVSFAVVRVSEDIHLLKEMPVLPEEEMDKIAPLSFEKGLVLEDITFRYQTSKEPVLKGVNAMVPKGKSVAFCGKSGAGKTTTVDILLGLLKPQSGAVLCDGINVNDSLIGWHKNLSYVPQDIYLIDDTIRANIAFGYNRSEINEEMVWKALEKAQLADFVRHLPNQLDSIIGEKGVRLSGGQRQRIGIARALYRDTPILILDEATSALDFETEGEILRSVEGLKGEKTLIIITHRLGTIENCDYIYKVEDNDIKLIKHPSSEEGASK